MSTPINEDNCAEIFDALTRSVRPFKLVDFVRPNPADGQTFQVAIRPLNLLELQHCQAAGVAGAKKYAKENGLLMTDPGVDVIQENARVIELLWKAYRNPNDLEKSLFKTPLEMMKTMTNHELTLMIESYARVETELSPLIATMTEEDLRHWIEMLAKGGDSARNFLDRMTSAARNALLISLAAQVFASQTDNGSPIEPASEE